MFHLPANAGSYAGSCHALGVPAYRPEFAAPKSRPATENIAPGATGKNAGSNIGNEIRMLLAATSKMDRRVRKDVVALYQNLIALRYAFSLNTREGTPQFRVFSQHEPIRHFNVTRAGMQHRLDRISPSLAEDNMLVGALKNLVNHARLDKHARKYMPGGVPDAWTEQAPCRWPIETLLGVLRIGEWDQIDLSGIELSNANFRKMNMPGVNFRGAMLRECDFRGCDLSRSNFIGSDIRLCNFRDTDLTMANMESVMADGVNLRNADLSMLKARKASFIRANFTDAITSNANFSEAHMEYAIGVQFDQGAVFVDAELNHLEAGWDLNKNPFLNVPPEHIGRQLWTLSTIHPRHDELHNTIVYRLVKAMGDDHANLHKSPLLMNMLVGQSRCWSDPRIRELVNNKLLPAVLGNGDAGAIEPRDVESLMAQADRYLKNTLPVPSQRGNGEVAGQPRTDRAPLFSEGPDTSNRISCLPTAPPAEPTRNEVFGRNLEAINRWYKAAQERGFT